MICVLQNMTARFSTSEKITRLTLLQWYAPELTISLRYACTVKTKVIGFEPRKIEAMEF